MLELNRGGSAIPGAGAAALCTYGSVQWEPLGNVLHAMDQSGEQGMTSKRCKGKQGWTDGHPHENDGDARASPVCRWVGWKGGGGKAQCARCDGLGMTQGIYFIGASASPFLAGKRCSVFF